MYGGDDLTLVCDERLALGFVERFVANYEAITAQLFESYGGKITVSAGICMGPRKYPFARLYELSEQLCGSAKKRLKESGSQGSAIDWLISFSELNEDLGQLRQTSFVDADGHSLTLGPALFEPSDKTGWHAIRSVTLSMQGKEWQSRRNKLKALRSVVRKGATAVKSYRDVYLPGVSVPSAENHVFDAIEFMERYIPIGATEVQAS